MGPVVHLLIRYKGQVLHRGSHSEFPVILGRSADSHVSLAYSFVSRHHCAISVDDEGILVRDLGSRHKLTVDGVSAGEFRASERGGFMIGDIDVEARLDRGDDAESTRGAGAAPTRTFQQEMLLAKPAAERHPLERGGGPLVPSRPPPGAAIPDPVPGPDEVAPRAKTYRPYFEGKAGEFEWAVDPGVESIRTSDEIVVQGAVSWGARLHDLRNHVVGDKIAVGPSAGGDLSLPLTGKTIALGRFESQGAKFVVPPGLPWSLRRGGADVSEKILREEQRIKDVKGGGRQLMLQKQEILTLGFAPDVKAHFRYIRRPREDFPPAPRERTGDSWKGLQVAIVFHLLLLSVWFVAGSGRPSVPAEGARRFARLVGSAPEPPPRGTAAPVPAKPDSAAEGASAVERPKIAGANAGLSVAEVGAVVNAAAGEILGCFAIASAAGPVPPARIEYEWEIDAAGAVVRAAVKGTEEPGTEFVNQCAIGLIRAMKFPPARNGSPTTASTGFLFGRRP